jgi:hypothetical protein
MMRYPGVSPSIVATRIHSSHNCSGLTKRGTQVKAQRSRGFGHQWLAHWITGLLLSLLCLFLLQPFEPKALSQMLDRAGADAVMQAYAAGWDESHLRVVVVDMGPEVTTALLAKVLEEIRGAGAIAVGLDFKIVEDPREGSGESDDAKKSKAVAIPIEDLLAVLGDKAKWGQTRVALPVLNSRLKKGIANLLSARQPESRLGSDPTGQDRVRAADPDLDRDEDGVVRTTRDRVCSDSIAGQTMIRTLAAAMVRDARHPSQGCELRPILFVPVWVPEDEPSPDSIEKRIKRGSDILLITRQWLTAHPEVLQGSYVLLGQLEGDSFVTPVGKMPGVLIHAQSARTLAKDLKESWWVHVLPHWTLDIFLGVLAGAVFSLYVTVFGSEQKVRSLQGALYSFLRGLGGLFLIGLFVFFAGVLWTWLGAGLVQKGLLIGAVTAVFGAMLETLVHVGRNLVEPIHWLVSRVIGRRTVPVLLGLLCLSSVTARAEDCRYELWVDTGGDREDVEIQPGSHSVKDDGTPVEPFVRIIVKHARTSVHLVQAGTELPRMELKGADPPQTAALIVPPCPPEPALAGAWHAFWAALNPKEPLRSSGATLVYRGLGKDSEAGVGGPLRELTNLAPATGTVLGSSGLAFSWAGGTPPYSIAIEDDINGGPLGRVQVSKPWLWLPQWRTPDLPFVIIVRDAEGVELWRHLRPLPAAAIADGEIGDAISLFETDPVYRLEALRRLATRAEGGDVLAGRAVALLQLSGAKE